MNARLAFRTDSEPTEDDRITTFLEGERGSDFIGRTFDCDVPWLQEALAYALVSNDWLYFGNQAHKHLDSVIAKEAREDA
jgi:hypothetical protein